MASRTLASHALSLAPAPYPWQQLVTDGHCHKARFGGDHAPRCSGPLASKALPPRRCLGELQRRHQTPQDTAAAITATVATAAMEVVRASPEPVELHVAARGAALHAFEIRQAMRQTPRASEKPTDNERGKLSTPAMSSTRATTPLLASTRASTPAQTPSVSQKQMENERAKLSRPSMVSTRATTPLQASTRGSTPAPGFERLELNDSGLQNLSSTAGSLTERLRSQAHHREVPSNIDEEGTDWQSTRRMPKGFCSPADLADTAVRDRRRERIEELQQGLMDHDEESLSRVQRGTAPLLGAVGEPVLPVPPLEVQDSRLPLSQRLRLLSQNRSSKEAVRNMLMTSKILGDEAKDRPLEDFVRQTLGQKGSPGPTAPVERYEASRWDRFGLTDYSLKELFQEAEHLSRQGTEEQWIRLASQFCSRAYDAELPEVLRMVRLVAIVTTKPPRWLSAAGKKDLKRAADHVLQSLTGRLEGSDVDFITEVIDTMSQACVGTQVFLDMLMTYLLGLHRRNRKVPGPLAALHLASALGRLASPEGQLRLRPRGTGGQNAVTNQRVMDILSQRITENLDLIEGKDLASIDEYYLTRLIEEADQKVLIERMAELDLGLAEETKDYLPEVLILNESIHREISEPLRWSMPRYVRQYLERVKMLRLEKNTPWVLGFSAPSPSSPTSGDKDGLLDLFSPRRRLHELRAWEDETK